MRTGLVNRYRTHGRGQCPGRTARSWCPWPILSRCLEACPLPLHPLRGLLYTRTRWIFLSQLQLVVVGIPSFFGSSKLAGGIAPRPDAPPRRRVQPVHQLGDPAPALVAPLSVHLDLLVHHHHHRLHHEPGPVPVEAGDHGPRSRHPARRTPDCRACTRLHSVAGRYVSRGEPDLQIELPLESGRKPA